VPDHADLASPESHWTVPIALRDLTTFLRMAVAWPSGAVVQHVARHGESMIVTGSGVSRTIPVETFRSAIDSWAPCLQPDRFPTASWTGSTLPVTVPSMWFRVATRPGGITLIGRGYGHGVGMVQWGAYGRARHGWSADRILAYYYGGLRPSQFREPGVIRVQVASGLTGVTVTPSGRGGEVDGQPVDGPFRISGGRTLTVSS
jgi:SpoIID/LytB domain protein